MFGVLGFERATAVLGLLWSWAHTSSLHVVVCFGGGRLGFRVWGLGYCRVRRLGPLGFRAMAFFGDGKDIPNTAIDEILCNCPELKIPNSLYCT